MSAIVTAGGKINPLEKLNSLKKIMQQKVDSYNTQKAAEVEEEDDDGNDGMKMDKFLAANIQD